MAVSPIPEGMQSITPYLIVVGADRLVAFLREAFGAEELFRMARPDGTIQHAKVRVAGSIVELADGAGGYPPRPGAIHLYVDDADATYRRAIEAGAASLYEPADMPYGERSGGVVDPTGNHWYIATQTEVLDRAELDRRVAGVDAGSPAR